MYRRMSLTDTSAVFFVAILCICPMFGVIVVLAGCAWILSHLTVLVIAAGLLIGVGIIGRAPAIGAIVVCLFALWGGLYAFAPTPTSTPARPRMTQEQFEDRQLAASRKLWQDDLNARYAERDAKLYAAVKALDDERRSERGHNTVVHGGRR